MKNARKGADKTPEDELQRALRTGAFDNLPGRGKPLDLEGYLNEDPETRLAHRMLKNNGYTLPWIDEMKEIERRVTELKERLAQAWRWRQGSLVDGRTPEWAESRWATEVETFRSRAKEINRDIVNFNLNVPSIKFQRSTVRIEKEIETVQNSSPEPQTR